MWILHNPNLDKSEVNRGSVTVLLEHRLTVNGKVQVEDERVWKPVFLGSYGNLIQYVCCVHGMLDCGQDR